jgi:hypothetical protein
MLYQEKSGNPACKDVDFVHGFHYLWKTLRTGNDVITIIIFNFSEKIGVFWSKHCYLAKLDWCIRKLAHIFSQNIAEDREKFLL